MRLVPRGPLSNISVGYTVPAPGSRRRLFTRLPTTTGFNTHSRLVGLARGGMLTVCHPQDNASGCLVVPLTTTQLSYSTANNSGTLAAGSLLVVTHADPLQHLTVDQGGLGLLLYTSAARISARQATSFVAQPTDMAHASAGQGTKRQWLLRSNQSVGINAASLRAFEQPNSTLSLTLSSAGTHLLVVLDGTFNMQCGAGGQWTNKTITPGTRLLLPWAASLNLTSHDTGTQGTGLILILKLSHLAAT